MQVGEKSGNILKKHLKVNHKQEVDNGFTFH